MRKALIVTCLALAALVLAPQMAQVFRVGSALAGTTMGLPLNAYPNPYPSPIGASRNAVALPVILRPLNSLRVARPTSTPAPTVTPTPRPTPTRRPYPQPGS